MKRMIKFIVAVDEKWGIAKDHKIPWHFPEDFKFFKKTTNGYPCIMGYNTFKEIAEMRKYPEKNSELLPNRFCYVLSKNHTFHENESVLRVEEISDISDDDTFLIGGKFLYDLAVEVADEGYITRIKHDYDCDILFDHEELNKWWVLAEVIDETEDLRFERWVRK